MIKQHADRRERKPPGRSAEGPRACKTHDRGNQPYDRAQRQRPNDQGYEIRRLFECSLHLIGLEQCKKTKTHQLLPCQYHLRQRVRENSLDTTGFSRVVHQLQPNQSRTLFGYHRLQPHGVSVSAYFARKTELEVEIETPRG